MNLKQISFAVAIVISSALAGCGGGSSGGKVTVPNPPTDPNNPNIPDPNPNPNPGINNLVALCTPSEPECGTTDNSTYSGSKTGLWVYKNNTNVPVTVPYNISGVQNKSVTKSVVNLSLTPVSLGSTSFFNEVQPEHSQKSLVSNMDKLKDLDANFKKRLREEEEETIKNLVPNPHNSVSTFNVAPVSTSMLAIGTVKTFIQSEGASGKNVSSNYTLAETGTLPDGRVLNVWVESVELGGNKINQSDVLKIKTSMLNTYSNLIGLSGKPYSVAGSTSYINLIPDTSLQPINVMLSNITPDNQGYGVVGYFSSRNHQTKISNALSNEALQVFLDTETIYRPMGNILDNSGMYDILRNESLDLINSTLTHEFTHMIAFHERILLKKAPNTSTFMGEAIALASEDIMRNSSNYTSDNMLGTRVLFYNYGYGSNCQINTWSCYNMYENTSVLMAYLVRQYGVKFYKDYLADTSSNDDLALLDKAIKANGGVSLADALINYQVLRAGLKESSAQKFGLPSITSQGYTLRSYNKNFPVSDNLVKPSTLEGLGASYFNTQANVSSVSGSVTVPANSAFVLIVK